jgi:hypothetical protein
MIFIIALLAIVVWLKMDNPLLAVFMVSAIDFSGFLPSFRKSFYEPWTETVISWIIFAVGNIFVVLSLSEYNLLTLTYLVAITIGDVIIAVICLVRRRVIAKSF